MILDGFRLLRGWLDPAITLELVRDAIPWVQGSFRMFGREVLHPRLTAWMGEAAYTYSRRRHDPAPTPEVVEAIRHALEPVTGARFNSVLGNLYRDGRDSVAWHADDERELGPEPTIASLSLGASRTFLIKPRRACGEVSALELRHGDLLVMSGRSQADYLHSVPKVPGKVGPRVNLTFRLISFSG